MCGNGQLMGAMGLSLSTVPRCLRGTILVRGLQFGANTPCNRVRFSRGLGTRAASEKHLATLVSLRGLGKREAAKRLALLKE